MGLMESRKSAAFFTFSLRPKELPIRKATELYPRNGIFSSIPANSSEAVSFPSIQRAAHQEPAEAAKSFSPSSERALSIWDWEGFSGSLLSAIS